MAKRKLIKKMIIELGNILAVTQVHIAESGENCTHKVKKINNVLQHISDFFERHDSAHIQGQDLVEQTIASTKDFFTKMNAALKEKNYQSVRDMIEQADTALNAAKAHLEHPAGPLKNLMHELTNSFKPLFATIQLGLKKLIGAFTNHAAHKHDHKHDIHEDHQTKPTGVTHRSQRPKPSPFN